MRPEDNGRPRMLTPREAVDIAGVWDAPPTPVRYLGNVQDAMDGPPVAFVHGQPKTA